jgi:hypothetical protein
MAAEIEQTMALYRAAKAWHNNPNSASLSAGAANFQRSFERSLTAQRKQVALRPNAPVDRKLPDLLAALELELEAHLGQ